MSMQETYMDGQHGEFLDILMLIDLLSVYQCSIRK
jgi:hypothetical protein